MKLMSMEELLAEVLRLPRRERARVAEELLSSLEEADEADVAAAWAQELERRSGEVEPVPWSTARAEIRSELQKRRARRSAS